MQALSADATSFTWRNSSTPTSHCPLQEIRTLYDPLVLNAEGQPSSKLKNLASPVFIIKRVEVKLIGLCEGESIHTTPTTDDTHTGVEKTNFKPRLINPIDSIDATLGEKLVYQVADDWCYDTEDGSSRNLKLSLQLTKSNGALPKSSWIQFDTQSRQFFGVPLEEDKTENPVEYSLMCTDRDGLVEVDAIIIDIKEPGPTMPGMNPYSALFSAFID